MEGVQGDIYTLLRARVQGLDPFFDVSESRLSDAVDEGMGKGKPR